jgi:hypothetical protein
MILIVHLNKLITKTEKDYWMALVTDERNKTIVALKTDLAIMKTIELMIKFPTREFWIKKIKEKARKSLIVTNMHKASLAALVNTIKNILNSYIGYSGYYNNKTRDLFLLNYFNMLNERYSSIFSCYVKSS